MSYKSSNLYASKVFAEHPLVMWSMDEDINYISLISESEKNLSNTNWTIENGFASYSFTEPTQNPIQDSPVAKIYRESSSAGYVEVLLNPIDYSSSIDTSKGSICFNSYIYIPEESLVSNIIIGFYIDGEYSYSTYGSFYKKRWYKVEYTKDLDSSNDISPFIRIEYEDLGGDGESQSSVFFAGVSVGQWSEQFNSFDTGIQKQNLPSNILEILDVSGESVKCVTLDPYGLDNSNVGYAIIDGKKLLDESSGVPVVYGSRNNMSILDSESGLPSLIFPGKGFLNQSGIYSNITVEFWTRINNEYPSQTKIFGPISSNDGIYLDTEFITVKVGQYVKSYFIGQWYRPMLVHFGQTLSEIYLLINGEKVISINIDSLDIETFPSAEEDYLGFYANEEMMPFEIDIFSIFPYIVTEQVAKRRFVYGQGSESQEIITSSLGGDLTHVDFPYSGYSSTISYPDRTPWTNGYSNNLDVSSSGISLPKLPLPELIFSSNSEDVSEADAATIWENFYYDNYAIQSGSNTFINMLPNISYSDISSTIYFSKINKGGNITKSIYALLETGEDIDAYQSVLYISNNINTNYFEAKIDSGSIQYVYNNEVLYSVETDTNTEISIGIDIDKIVQSYPQVNGFFSNLDSTSLNFAGIQNNTFFGKIFSLTINNKFFTEKDSGMFNEDGFSEIFEGVHEYIGSYTLLPKNSNLTTYLDVAATGYWEASVPMTYFGKYVTSKTGSKFYDLDLIQFNIDIPATLYSTINEDAVAYHDAMSAKSYLTLQHKDNVGMIPYTEYVNTVDIQSSRVLDFDLYNNLDSTKFDVYNATAIFPPKEIGDFKDYYITTHILMTSKGINTNNMTIKNMSFSSMAFDEASFYPIGTPTGRNIYPVSKIGNDYIYKTKIPVVIETESNQYLYVSGDSGISVLPSQDLGFTNAISFPINETLKNDFRMVGFQIYLMFNENDYFGQRKLIAKFYNHIKEYGIYITPELDQKRGVISIVDLDTGDELPGLKFFLNGKEVTKPVVRPFRWNALTVSLQDSSLDFYQQASEDVDQATIGQFEIYSGVRIDNFSAFSDINEIKQSLTITDKWSDILDYGAGSWSDVASYTWEEILDEQLTPIIILSIDGKNIFDTYFGLSNIIGDDNSTLNVNFDSINVLNDAEWTTFEYRPI